MAATPLYKGLKLNGTTFYAFPGAAEDISAAYQNQNYRMYFSKYILLNLPKQNTNPGTGTTSVPVYWDFENAAGQDWGFQRSVFSTPTTTYQEQLVESLRNYVANQEVTIKESRLNNTEYFYDNTVLSTPTENIFWKWCKKLNLVDFELAVDGDEYFGNLPEFARNNLNDDEFFPEFLWREREVVEWETVSFYETGVNGFTNQLEIEFQGTTNFRVGDLVELGNLSNSTLIGIFGTGGSRLTVDYIMDPTATLGQRIVFDTNFVSGSQSETSGTVKLVYDRLVQYIGEVNGINNVNEANRSYTEVYAHVPDHTGRTPDILFRTRVDENYKPNMVYPILPSQYQPEIVGAAINGSLNFDNPLVNNPAAYPGNYYGQFDTVDFTYETSSGDSIRRSGDYFGVSGDINVPIINGSTIDGISIDFDRNHYVKMNIVDREVFNFDQFNALSVNNEPPKDFEFNAILWYYTVEDLFGNVATNLYGISFVDNPNNNPVESEVGIRVPTFKKLAATDDQDGTSYAFSLNLSFNIVNENPQDTYNPEAINSLFSMNLFNQAMSQLASVNQSFLDIVANQNNLETQVTNLNQLLYTQTDFATINARINNLDNLLRLYSTNQMVDSDSIRVNTDNTTSPPQISLESIEPNYTTIYEAYTTNLYNANGAVPFLVTVPEKKNFLVHVINNDTVNLTLPNDDRLVILIEQDLRYRQSMDIVVESDLVATQNKKLEVYINFFSGQLTNAPVETKLLETIDLPIFYNSTTQLTNSAYNWSKMSFTIDLARPFQLNTGGILEVPIEGNYRLVNNSFKVGDTVLLRDFTIGTTSQLDFSGQYTIDSIGATNSYIYLNVNSNTSLINYGNSASNITVGSLPLPFNSTTTYTYILSNVPYLDLNRGMKYRITRINESDFTSIDERYLIERIKL